MNNKSTSHPLIAMLAGIALTAGALVAKPILNRDPERIVGECGWNYVSHTTETDEGVNVYRFKRGYNLGGPNPGFGEEQNMLHLASPRNFTEELKYNKEYCLTWKEKGHERNRLIDFTEAPEIQKTA